MHYLELHYNCCSVINWQSSAVVQNAIISKTCGEDLANTQE